MARQRTVPVFAISIAADPHPPEVYEQILIRSSTIIAHARGTDYARITKPIRNPTNDNLLSGKLHIWTDIDLKGDWIDLERQDKLSAEDLELISIPEHARPNFRVFEYVFDISKHTMYIEAKNDLDQTIGHSVLYKIINTIVSVKGSGKDFPEVSATLVPEEGVAEELLSVQSIRYIHIKVYRPNTEFASPAAAKRVYALMDEMNVHVIDQKLTRNSNAETIHLTGITKDLAEVAVDVGELRVQGRDHAEKKVDLSSRDRPRKLDVPMDRNDSFLARLLEKVPGLGRA